MMRRDSLSALPVPQKVGDGQSDVCVYMGGGDPREPFSIHNTVGAKRWGLTAGAEVSVGFISMRLTCRFYSPTVSCGCRKPHACMFCVLNRRNYLFWCTNAPKIEFMNAGVQVSGTSYLVSIVLCSFEVPYYHHIQ